MTTGSTPTRRARLNRQRARGFTLIEIMVVMVILGILGAVVVPSLLDKPGQARQNAVRLDLRTIESALARYKLENYDYPSTQQGLEALVSKPSGSPEARNWAGPYVAKVPTDPWQRPYQYLSPGVKGEVDVFSYGRDGRPGGEGEDADIGNWDSQN